MGTQNVRPTVEPGRRCASSNTLCAPVHRRNSQRLPPLSCPPPHPSTRPPAPRTTAPRPWPLIPALSTSLYIDSHRRAQQPSALRFRAVFHLLIDVTHGYTPTDGSRPNSVANLRILFNKTSFSLQFGRALAAMSVSCCCPIAGPHARDRLLSSRCPLHELPAPTCDPPHPPTYTGWGPRTMPPLPVAMAP